MTFKIYSKSTQKYGKADYKSKEEAEKTIQELEAFIKVITGFHRDMDGDFEVRELPQELK